MPGQAISQRLGRLPIDLTIIKTRVGRVTYD